MAASGLASIADAGAARGPPTVPVRWCSSCSDWLLQHVLHPGSPERRRQRHLGEPLLIAALTAWVTLSYVVCGLVAWWRRPANRFGPLLIIAGFVSFLSTLVWSSRDVLRTLGQALDLVPPVLFLHVFLAFPGWAAEGPVRAELRRDRVRRCDRTRARSDVRRRLRAAQFVASAETSGQGVYRRRAGAITRTLPIDRFCFFERRTIDGPRYVDPGRHVQLAEDVTDV